MNDLTYLIDECIEKLMEIKRYQDLKEDTDRWNGLDEETKQLENQKFADNDRLVKTELKVYCIKQAPKLFNEIHDDYNRMLSR